MPGMEWNEKDSMSNEHARDRWATMTLQGTRQAQISSHRVLLLVNLSYRLQLSRSGPQPGKFWSSKCRGVKFETGILNKLQWDESHYH